MRLPCPSHLLVPLFLTAALTAQLTPTGPFTGFYQEGFETQSYTSCVPARVFQNHGDFCTPGHSGVLVTYGWLLYVGYAEYPRNGSNSFAGTTLGHGWFTFDAPVQRFGAYFGTVGYLAGGIANFYDANHVLIGTMPITAPRGGWAWNGWDVGHGGAKIQQIEVIANDPYNGGALICIDDAEVDVSVGSITTTTLGCGTLPITAGGLPVPGDTISLSLPTSTAFQGFVIGQPIAPQPIAACPGCQVGVSGFTAASRSLSIDVPNSPTFLDFSFAAQGFRFAGGTCLGFASVSDRVEVWIGN